MPRPHAADLSGPPPSPGSGIALYLAALVLFASFDAAIKHLLTLYPAPFLNVMRYLSVATIAAGLVLRHGLPRLSATPDKGLLLLRGLMLGTVEIGRAHV